MVLDVRKVVARLVEAILPGLQGVDAWDELRTGLPWHVSSPALSSIAQSRQRTRFGIGQTRQPTVKFEVLTHSSASEARKRSKRRTTWFPDDGRCFIIGDE